MWSAACPLELIRIGKTQDGSQRSGTTTIASNVGKFRHLRTAWWSSWWFKKGFSITSHQWEHTHCERTPQLGLHTWFSCINQASNGRAVDTNRIHLKSLKLHRGFPYLWLEFPGLNFKLVTPKLSKCTTPEVNIKLGWPRQINVYSVSVRATKPSAARKMNCEAVIMHFIWRHIYIWKNDDRWEARWKSTKETGRKCAESDKLQANEHEKTQIQLKMHKR